MMRTLVTRSSERVHNSLVRVPAVDAALVSVLLLTLGLTFSPARAGAQTVSQAFVNLFSGARRYVDPASAAKQQADAWRRSRPTDAALMDKIAAQPVAQWLGGWNVDIGRDVANAVSRITGAKALPSLSPTTFPVVIAGSIRRVAPVAAMRTSDGFALLPTDSAIVEPWSFSSLTPSPE